MRKLVTVRTVHTIQPIEGADNIELAQVDGWQVVCKKGEFKRFDRGVFFEIDSFLPCMTDDRFAFLTPRAVKWGDKVGARIRTMKLRGCLSQGLLLPLESFPEIQDYIDLHRNEMDFEDMDFTELLGIEKWERLLPQSLRGTARGNFPSFIFKTDQERVNNIRGLFEKYGNEVFQESIKMDGSSMTVYFYANPDFDEPKKGVCSRNLDLVETEGNLFWSTANKNNILNKLEEYCTLNNVNLAIQGELCGSTIQSNFEGFPEGVHDYYVYDIFDIDKQKYLTPKEVQLTAAGLGLNHVPVTGYYQLNEIAWTTADLLARASGKGINGKIREGLVYKHVGSGFSFKAISSEYLLKHGE